MKKQWYKRWFVWFSWLGIHLYGQYTLLRFWFRRDEFEKSFRRGLEFRLMANVLGLFAAMGVIPTMVFLYYFAEAIQLQYLLDQGRTIAYVIVTFAIIGIYALGVLATCLHLRWYEKHVAHVFEPQKPHEE